MQAVAPFDWQLTASYFVVAHFHYVIVGAILFNIFAAFYYWFPKVTGKMYNERGAAASRQGALGTPLRAALS